MLKYIANGLNYLGNLPENMKKTGKQIGNKFSANTKTIPTNETINNSVQSVPHAIRIIGRLDARAQRASTRPHKEKKISHYSVAATAVMGVMEVLNNTISDFSRHSQGNSLFGDALHTAANATIGFAMGKAVSHAVRFSFEKASNLLKTKTPDKLSEFNTNRQDVQNFVNNNHKKWHRFAMIQNCTQAAIGSVKFVVGAGMGVVGSHSGIREIGAGLALSGIQDITKLKDINLYKVSYSDLEYDKIKVAADDSLPDVEQELIEEAQQDTAENQGNAQNTVNQKPPGFPFKPDHFDNDGKLGWNNLDDITITHTQIIGIQERHSKRCIKDMASSIRSKIIDGAAIAYLAVYGALNSMDVIASHNGASPFFGFAASLGAAHGLSAIGKKLLKKNPRKALQHTPQSRTIRRSTIQDIRNDEQDAMKVARRNRNAHLIIGIGKLALGVSMLRNSATQPMGMGIISHTAVDFLRYVRAAKTEDMRVNTMDVVGMKPDAFKQAVTIYKAQNPTA